MTEIKLANYDGEGLFLPYSDFREEMLAFIDVYIVSLDHAS
jgi:hypothetical protein